MGKKICVYAICKNESKFVDRWYNSLKEADYIVVLDTGSTDNTVELLQKYSPHVNVKTEIINPWRFDTARNRALSMVPSDTDICVIADLDHVFRPGWADALREQFSNTNCDVVVGDIIDYDENKNEIKRFLSFNVHKNDPEWRWQRPIHESLVFESDRDFVQIFDKRFVIEHHPDRTKSRGSYLDLLKMEYEENNKDPMCAIYYGCELSFHNKNDESHKVFLKALDECDFTNHEDIYYQILLNVGVEYVQRKDFKTALEYYTKAKECNINTRRVYMHLSDLYYKMYIEYKIQGETSKVLNSFLDKQIKYIEDCLTEVTFNTRDWRDDNENWKDLCFYKLAHAYANKGEYLKSLGYITLCEYYGNDRDDVKTLKYFYIVMNREESYNE